MNKDFYKSAMKEAPFGYAYLRMICDENGDPCDFEYVDVNSSFEKLIGIKESELLGKCVSEFFPSIIENKADWMGACSHIAIHGGQKEIEQYSKVLEIWFRTQVYSPEKFYIINYYFDTSKEKEQLDKLSLLNGVVEEAEIKYKNIEQEKDTWERRLREIAEVLRIENDVQFQRIIENLPFALNITNNDGIILYANPKSFELFGFTLNDIGSKSVLEYWVDLKSRDLWINTLEEEGIVNDYEMHLKTSSGREFWAVGNGLMIQYQNQACILSTEYDISERKEIESALKNSEEKYRLLTEFTSDVIWVFNLTANIFTYVSPSIFYLTGQKAEEVLYLNFSDWLTPESAGIVADAIERDIKEFINKPNEQKSYITEARQFCKNGDVIWVEISSKFRFNDVGEIEIVGVSRNIEERKRAEREVLYLSYHDQLTGLYNRRFYEEELQRMNFQSNLPITLVLADVNGLKLTNDVFGHFAGDGLLKKFTAILNKVLKPEDVATRIGGDEFALLLPKTHSDQGEKLIGHIKTCILNDKSDNAILSVSFGLATKEAVTDDNNTLFLQAEGQMYHLKLSESAEMKSETIHLALQKLFQRNAMEQQHSERVGMLCKEIGNAMDLETSVLIDLELLGQMHDIGKIGVQEKILSKKKKLNQTEWFEIKRHTETGYQILRTADEFVHIAESVLSHHERMDGRGYPRNLKANEIPLASRILSIAEAFDSMTRAYPYKDSVSEDDAIKELIANSQTQFDGEIVRIFVEKVLKKA